MVLKLLYVCKKCSFAPRKKITIIILQYWGLNSGPTSWVISPALFYEFFFFFFFWDTEILLIFASWVATIIGVSHRCLVEKSVKWIIDLNNQDRTHKKN
jgi:hypothetical protein